MSVAVTEAFTSGQLDEIDCGTIELSVPLRYDVIQVGLGGDAEVGRIRVIRRPGLVEVTRVDGRPIQVDVLDGTFAWRVFDDPVAELRLVRTTAGWTSVGDCAAHPAAVKRFADVIGVFAVAKQERDQHSHRG